jgi:hypothetical protein
MIVTRHFVLAITVLCTALTGVANAQIAPQDNNGFTYFVHGAPGRDLSPAYDAGLALDVSVNGTCLLTRWVFGEIKGPYAMPPGLYDVQVSRSNALQPCTNAVIYEVSFPVYQGQSNFAVAAISPSNTFTGYLIATDFSPVYSTYTRAIVANVSSVPSIDALGFGLPTNNVPYAMNDIAAGSYKSNTYSLGIPAYEQTHFYAYVEASGSNNSPLNLTFQYYQQSVNMYFAVGSINTGSFRVLTKQIQDVF